MQPDTVQWIVVSALVKAYPATMTIDDLRRLSPEDDVEESVARLQIDGLASRFGDWVKASEPAARYAQLERDAAGARAPALGRRAA